MQENKTISQQTNQASDEKILLVLLPFWSPLIPPQGISCLKSFLLKHGYKVKADDANMDPQLRELYDNYFNALKKWVPRTKRGNFYSIGQDVLRNHMMAHINYEERGRYNDLVKDIIYKTYYIDVDDNLVEELKQMMDEFYRNLEHYFLELLEREKPTVLGLSMFNGTLPASCFITKLTKQKFPDIRIILGGGIFSDQLAPGTPNMDYFLERIGENIEKIFIGEGELLLLKYLKGELPTDQKIYTLRDIDNQLMDIRSAELPDYSDFNLEAYPNMPAYTSRSCPFQCSFCSETVQWGKYRKKSGKQIVDELVGMYREYGEQLFYMSDSLLNPVLDDLAEEFIKSGESIYWDGCIRADKHVCNKENTLKWRKGGYYRARLGMESASPRVLEMMTKKTTVKQMADAIAGLAYAGIKTSTLWLIGHPRETEEDFQQTLDFLEENRDYLYDAEATPFWYHLKGQSNSDEWFKAESVLLYPRTAKSMLIAQTWVLNTNPKREEIYDRLFRFTRHIERLGIPNPYSLHDIYEADKRWRRLHKNAVPQLVDLKNKDIYVDDNKSVKEINTVKNTLKHDGDWGF